jgi:hypothetical protein
MNRIAQKDFTLPRHDKLINEINDMEIAIKVHYVIKDTDENTIRVKNSAPCPNWESVADFLQKVRQELSKDRYNPIKR